MAKQRPKISREELRRIAAERWKNADIRDNFIFIKVLSNTAFSQPIMEAVLKRNLGFIETVDYEKAIIIDGKVRSVRLDLVFQGEKFICNLEMQRNTFRDKDKRLRYYHVMLDFDSIEKGQGFSTMKDKVVIVVCDTDPRGKGLPIYITQNVCLEDPSLEIDDGMTTILLNSKAYKKLEPGLLRDFLAYIEGEEPQHELIRAMDRHVRLIKKDKTLEDEFMSISLSALFEQYDVREEALEEGIEIGREESREEFLEEGIKIGEHKRSLEFAQSLIKTVPGFDDTTIANMTKLSLKEVQRIRREVESSLI